MTSKTLFRLSVRAVLAWCLLSGAGYLFAGPALRAFVPLMEFTIDTLQSGYRSHLALTDGQHDPRIVMSCSFDRPRFLPDGRFVAPDERVNCAYTDAVHAIVPIVIFLVTLVSWPATGRSEGIRRTLAALLALPCLVMLTTPVALMGLQSMGANPGLYDGSQGQLAALLQPFAIMELGGRWLLPLIAALVCIRLAPAQPPQTTAPAWRWPPRPGEWRRRS